MAPNRIRMSTVTRGYGTRIHIIRISIIGMSIDFHTSKSALLDVMADSGDSGAVT